MGFLQFSSLSSYPMASPCSSCSWTRLAWSSCVYQKKHIKQRPREMAGCREPVWGTPPVAKVMRKEARHTQRQDQASGVPLDSRASTPKTRVCLLYCFVLWPTPLTLQGAVPHHHLSLWKRVNLQLQLIKFLGVTGVFWLTDPSEGSLTCLTGLPGRLQLCIRLFTVCQLREAWEA